MHIAVVGVAWYKREDYELLLDLFVDRDVLHERYDDWLKSAERFVDDLRRSGQAHQKVYIDPATFPAWCAQRAMKIDANARKRFASEFVAHPHRRRQRSSPCPPGADVQPDDPRTGTQSLFRQTGCGGQGGARLQVCRVSG
jgi:hypothetical protein